MEDQPITIHLYSSFKTKLPLLLIDWLIDRLGDWSIDHSIDWLIDRSLVGLIDWLIDWLIVHFADPDSTAIPYLTALGDLLGTGLLAFGFYLLWLTGNKDSDVGNWKVNDFFFV